MGNRDKLDNMGINFVPVTSKFVCYETDEIEITAIYLDPVVLIQGDLCVKKRKPNSFESVCYSGCVKIRGKFDPIKAKSLGIPKGPLFGMIVSICKHLLSKNK